MPMTLLAIQGSSKLDAPVLDKSDSAEAGVNLKLGLSRIPRVGDISIHMTKTSIHWKDTNSARKAHHILQ